MNAVALWLLIRPIKRIKEFRAAKKAAKATEELMNLKALKSKTVWFGIIQLVFSAASAALAGGFTEEVILTLVTGTATILLRAVTDKPLSEK
jgi:hypothetical protein